MPSPFPGMNPYLENEEIWRDFHISFLTELRNSLNAGLVGSTFFARLEEQIFVHEPDAEQRLLAGYADVGVYRRGKTPNEAKGAVATLDAPFRVRIPDILEERQPYIEIRERGSRELVAVVELLSPSNKKPGPDREQFLGKRGNLLNGTAHYLEIDLLRGGGPRLPVEDLQPCFYYVLLSRVEDRPDAGFWPVQMRDPLPKILLPMRDPHPGVAVDLQEILHRTYDHAGYSQILQDLTPQPPLAPDDAKWAEAILKNSSTP